MNKSLWHHIIIPPRADGSLTRRPRLEVAVELRLVDHQGRPCFIWLPCDLFEMVRSIPKR